jgi:hypothetical protein
MMPKLDLETIYVLPRQPYQILSMYTQISEHGMQTLGLW